MTDLTASRSALMHVLQMCARQGFRGEKTPTGGAFIRPDGSRAFTIEGDTDTRRDLIWAIFDAVWPPTAVS